MNTERLAHAGDKLDRAWQQVAARLQTLSDPERQRRLRQVLYGIAAIWIVFALANLVWSLVPPPTPAPAPGTVINPLVEAGSSATRANVNIEEVAGWNLFGTAATAPAQVIEEEQVTAAGDDLDGIENNARETRLALTLQGIVSSTDEDKARAIIEAKREQGQYGVGDELPINKVKVAKILRDRVVLDNNGSYELLLLFDDTGLKATPSGEPAAARAVSARPVAAAEPARMDRRDNEQVTQVAETYRRRLYSNPQSLAQVVTITPERDGTQLKGYRVRPGRDGAQFEALGFKPGDVVTGVNGIQLSDPGKAMELYRVMRSASEASFDVLRDGQQLTLVVGLQDPEAARGVEP